MEKSMVLWTNNGTMVNYCYVVREAFIRKKYNFFSMKMSPMGFSK